VEVWWYGSADGEEEEERSIGSAPIPRFGGPVTSSGQDSDLRTDSLH